MKNKKPPRPKGREVRGTTLLEKKTEQNARFLFHFLAITASRGRFPLMGTTIAPFKGQLQSELRQSSSRKALSVAALSPCRAGFCLLLSFLAFLHIRIEQRELPRLFTSRLTAQPNPWASRFIWWCAHHQSRKSPMPNPSFNVSSHELESFNLKSVELAREPKLPSPNARFHPTLSRVLFYNNNIAKIYHTCEGKYPL
jgi:hypothetical protein